MELPVLWLRENLLADFQGEGESHDFPVAGCSYASLVLSGCSITGNVYGDPDRTYCPGRDLHFLDLNQAVGAQGGLSLELYLSHHICFEVLVND